LKQVCCWCIGEYGSALLDGSSLKDSDANEEGKQPTTPVVVTEEEVASVYQQILWDNHISVVTKQVNISNILLETPMSTIIYMT
jgi:hypothetical protein